MHRSLIALSLLAGCARSGAATGGGSPSSAEVTTPPTAKARPYEVTAPHGATRTDPWYWLRDDSRANPDVIAYLNAENAYTDAQLAPTKPLQDTVYTEIVGRVKQDDSTVPWQRDGDWFYTRYEEGKDYPIYAWKRGSPTASEDILLDVNQLAEGKDYYQVANWQLSPDKKLLAYLEDAVGRRQYTLRIKRVDTGEVLPDRVSGLSTSLAWAADSATILVVENDPATLLSKRVKAHNVGSAAANDRLIYEEPDDTFYLSVDRTRSREFICVHSSATITDELRCAPSTAPDKLQVFAPRDRGVEYSADHFDGRWVIRTNLDAPNFRLMQAPTGAWGSRSAWKPLVAYDPEVYTRDVELFGGFIAIAERTGGLDRVRILHDDGRSQVLDAEEDAYVMALATNADPNTRQVRTTYESLTTPETTSEHHVDTGTRTVLKVADVPGYDPSGYRTERRWVTARDGEKVPVTLLYRAGFTPDGTAPLLQYGYGSYGYGMRPWFNKSVISLVDRGVVYAIAHIRGGDELGRRWYDQGRLKHKMNTFTDFIDVTQALVADGFAAPDRVAAMGGSAGGLLMGAITNMAPERYRAIVSQVPFVDVVTTMLDTSIPLTTNEYDEWGNPEDPDWYEVMLAYSPYDQLAEGDYPAILVTTGLWDSQVQYWEPAKYVAKLRTLKRNRAPLLLRTNMDAGHGGKSGRFRRQRETAEVYAFLLRELGVASEE